MLYAGRRNALLEALRDHLGGRAIFDPPYGGLFVWVRLTGVDTTALLQRSLAAGVAYVPGGAFAVDRTAGCDARLAFAAADESKLEEAVVRLAGVLEG